MGHIQSKIRRLFSRGPHASSQQLHKLIRPARYPTASDRPSFYAAYARAARRYGFETGKYAGFAKRGNVVVKVKGLQNKDTDHEVPAESIQSGKWSSFYAVVRVYHIRTFVSTFPIYLLDSISQHSGILTFFHRVRVVLVSTRPYAYLSSARSTSCKSRSGLLVSLCTSTSTPAPPIFGYGGTCSFLLKHELPLTTSLSPLSSSELAGAAKRDSSSHGIFDPRKSSSAKKANGTWNISYGDGSSASGDVYSDIVSVAGVSIPHQSVELASKLSESFLQDGGSDGLLGLAWPNINTVEPSPVKTPVENMIDQGLIEQVSVFNVVLRQTDDRYCCCYSLFSLRN